MSAYTSGPGQGARGPAGEESLQGEAWGRVELVPWSGVPCEAPSPKIRRLLRWTWGRPAGLTAEEVFMVGPWASRQRAPTYRLGPSWTSTAFRSCVRVNPCGQSNGRRSPGLRPGVRRSPLRKASGRQPRVSPQRDWFPDYSTNVVQSIAKRGKVNNKMPRSRTEEVGKGWIFAGRAKSMRVLREAGAYSGGLSRWRAK